LVWLSRVISSSDDVHIHRGGVATIGNAIENFFNNGGTLATAFVPLFGLTGSNLTSGLDQLSGLRALDDGCPRAIEPFPSVA
jgi:hypothetical protein